MLKTNDGPFQNPPRPNPVRKESRRHGMSTKESFSNPRTVQAASSLDSKDFAASISRPSPATSLFDSSEPISDTSSSAFESPIGSSLDNTAFSNRSIAVTRTLDIEGPESKNSPTCLIEDDDVHLRPKLFSTESKRKPSNNKLVEISLPVPTKDGDGKRHGTTSDFKHSEIGQRLLAGLEHPVVQGILLLALVTTLFLPDLWVIGNPANDADPLLNAALIISFAIFTLEIVITSLVKSDYYNSAFFWMDIIGTISIVIDLTWTSDFLLTLPGGADPGTLRAARVAKLGVKAGRMARVTKFFKFVQFTAKSNGSGQHDSATRISAKMGSVLSQRVALLIMTIVVINPFLTPGTKDYSGSGFLLSFDQVANTDAFSAEQWSTSISKFSNFYRNQRLKDGMSVANPVWLKVRGISKSSCPSYTANDEDFSTDWQTISDGSGLCRYTFDRGDATHNHIIRRANKHWATSSGYGRYENERRCSAGAPEFSYVCDRLKHVDVLFDFTPVAVEEAWFSVALIWMVIFLLLIFSATFAVAVDSLVVKPIARIMSNLTQSAEAVLASVQMVAGDGDDDVDNITETDVLELIVDKLARLVTKSILTKGDMMKEMLDEDGGNTDKHTTAWLSDIYTADIALGETFDSRVGWKQLPVRARMINISLPVDESVLNSLEAFDVLSIEQEKLIPCIRFMFERYQLPKEFGISLEVLEEWIIEVKDGYNNLPYHGWLHGVDVMHTVYIFLDQTRASEYMSKLEFFALLVAALAHDIGHPGVNNGFLVRTKHELALLHNDASPLENMHASRLYETFQDPKSNILANLTEAQWQACRRQILACILNTDMANHFTNVQKLEVLDEINGPFIKEFFEKRLTSAGSEHPIPDCLKDPANRLNIQEAILHAGDLSNPILPPKLSEKWVKRVTDEFFDQGDQEKAMGLEASPMCDRATANIPNMQLGFIDFIITPFYSVFFKFFPESPDSLKRNIQANYEHFAKLRATEAPDEKEKLEERTKKLRDKFNPNVVTKARRQTNLNLNVGTKSRRQTNLN